MSDTTAKERFLAEDSPDGETSESATDSDLDSDYECTVCKKKFSGAIPLRQHEKGSKHKKVLARQKKERKLLDNNSEDEGSSEIFIPEPFQVCKVCDKQFSGPEPYYLHMKSKAHKQKKLEASILEMVREKGEINTEKLKEFYKTKKRAAAGVDVTDSNKEALASDDSEDNVEGDKEEYECKDCGKVFCGLKPFTQHLLSKTHAKHMKTKNLISQIVSGTSGEPSDESITNDVSAIRLEDDILVCKVCSTAFSGPQSAKLHQKSQKHAKKLEKYTRKLQKKKNESVKPKELDFEPTGNGDISKTENKQKEETSEEKEKPNIQSETVKTKDANESTEEEVKDSSHSSSEKTEDVLVSKEKTKSDEEKSVLYRETRI